MKDLPLGRVGIVEGDATQTNMAVERSTQMAFVGLPFLKDEGAATQFDNNAGERFTWAFVHIEVALGYAITRKAIDDNLYKAQFNPTNLKLQEAFAQFKEIQAANILNLPEYAGSADTHFDGVRPMNHQFVIPMNYVEKVSSDFTINAGSFPVGSGQVGNPAGSIAPQVGPDANQTNVWALK